MKISDAACRRGQEFEIKRGDWPEHSWLRFRWIEGANGEFATMFESGDGNEYIFSRDDLTADNWEVRVVNVIAECWQGFAEGARA